MLFINLLPLNILLFNFLLFFLGGFFFLRFLSLTLWFFFLGFLNLLRCFNFLYLLGSCWLMSFMMIMYWYWLLLSADLSLRGFMFSNLSSGRCRFSTHSFRWFMFFLLFFMLNLFFLVSILKIASLSLFVFCSNSRQKLFSWGLLSRLFFFNRRWRQLIIEHTCIHLW